MNGVIIPRQANEFHRKLKSSLLKNKEFTGDREGKKKHKNHKRSRVLPFSGEIFLEGMSTEQQFVDSSLVVYMPGGIVPQIKPKPCESDETH